MQKIIYLSNRLVDLLDQSKMLSFLAPLALRLFLAPVFIIAGWNKLSHFEATANWFGSYLGLPFPELMVVLAAGTEFVGGFLLIAGLATRFISLPLMVTMLVAAFAVHWPNGWYAIAPTNAESSSIKVFMAIGLDAAEQSAQNSVEVKKRLDRAKGILREHGNYAWLSEKGGFAILQNGIEFAITYFIMCLVLFFSGAGRLSLDHLIAQRFRDIR